MKWIPADMSKGPLPFPSRICSLDWVNLKHEQTGVGEVWNRDRNFVNVRHPFAIEGDHICGTADEFANGEVLDVSRPLTKYSPSGIPLCCDPTRREADGRLSIVSSSYYTSERTYRSSGRIAIGGITRTVRSDPYHTGGSVAFSISSRTVRSEPYHSGGLVAITATTTTEDAVAYFGGGLVAIIASTHYTSSVACAVLADTCVDAPLTWTDHECEIPLPILADEVPTFPTGWREYEVEPDTDYNWHWNFVLGLGVGGFYILYRGDSCPVKEEVHGEAFLGASADYAFNTESFRRVFVYFQDVESDTSEDTLLVELNTL